MALPDFLLLGAPKAGTTANVTAATAGSPIDELLGRVLPAVDQDIALLESLTGLRLEHWRDVRNGTSRRPLELDGRFGTAYRSIDRPVAP